MLEIIGWLGGILLALCGLPLAIQSYKTKSSAGISGLFLLMWGAGEVFTLFFLLPKSDVLPLLFNYTCNIVFISIVSYYKVKEMK